MTKDFGQVWRDVAGIDGWLTLGQGELLFRTASAVRPGEAIVEIGSHHGRSTVIMASAKQAGVPLIAIDPYDDPRWGGGEAAIVTFNENLARRSLDGDVNHLRTFGAQAGDAWDGMPVGLLFVDGAHDYPTVRADLEAWIGKLSPTAVVLMHDAYSSPGVTRAMFQAFFVSGRFSYLASQRSLVAFRCGQVAAGGRARSALQMLTGLPWFARNIAIKLAIRNGWKALPPLLGHRQATLPY
jgi:predicted O-methyltransferase YrrM